MKKVVCSFSIAISFFFADKIIAQHTYGSFFTNDALVNYILAKNKTESAAIVMVPGLNLTTYIMSTTPDNRKGWGDMFADKGFDVYMVNDPKFDFTAGSFVGPFKFQVMEKHLHQERLKPGSRTYGVTGVSEPRKAFLTLMHNFQLIPLLLLHETILM